MNTNFILRPVTKEDYHAIAETINASSMDILGTTWAVVTDEGRLSQSL